MVRRSYRLNYLTRGLQFIGYREKTRPQLIKKEPLDNLPGNAELSSYPFFLFFLLSGNREQREISVYLNSKFMGKLHFT